MTTEQFNQITVLIEKSIDTSVEKSVERVVNGKIRRLDEKIDTYIQQDNQWKEDVKPSIETMKRFEGFTTTGAAILKGLLLIGGAVTTIAAFFKFMRN